VSCVPQRWNQLGSQVTGHCAFSAAPATRAFSTGGRFGHTPRPCCSTTRGWWPDRRRRGPGACYQAANARGQRQGERVRAGSMTAVRRPRCATDPRPGRTFWTSQAQTLRSSSRTAA